MPKENKHIVINQSWMSGGGKRLSNIELYRIIVTLFVLIVHFNGYFNGLDTKLLNFNNVAQIIIESATALAVNGFLLITGYFGIKNLRKTLWKLYKCMICITIPLMAGSAVYHGKINIDIFIKAFFPFSTSDNYFINGYIVMVLFSPFINKMNDIKILFYIIISLIITELWYDCILNLSTFGWKNGYGPQHFVLLYIIGRYLKLKGTSIYYGHKVWLTIYLLSIIMISLLCYFKINWALNYSNPLIVISAVSLFMIFVELKPFYSTIINSFASCSLFVYILQISSPFETYLIKIDKYFFNSYDYLSYLILCLIVIFSFYFFSYLWYKGTDSISAKSFEWIESKLKL